MKILKKILIGIAIVIALLLVTALFVKKEYTVERALTINTSKQEVFEYIKLLKNHAEFNVWSMMDPEMKTEYTGTDGTVGFKSAWDSKHENVGKGEQTIAKITEGERVDFDLHFIKPFEGIAKAYMSTTASAENQTTVKWAFESKMPYPMNLMLVFMNMDNMLGADLEKGLLNLKNNLEK